MGRSKGSSESEVVIGREREVHKTRVIDEVGEGTLVEVSIDEDGFQGAWFAATIVKVEENGKYLVKYNKLRRDDDADFLTEIVDKRRTRPCPPEAIIVDGFNVNEEVDAFYNDGWWEGFISKVRHGGRYRVYFQGTDDEGEFKHSELRPRQS